MDTEIKKYEEEYRTVKGVRTSCINGKSEEVDVTFQCKKYKDGPLAGEIWLQVVEGGVTGYESAELIRMRNRPAGKPWFACAGTKGSWDSLEIPESSLVELLKPWRVEDVPGGE